MMKCKTKSGVLLLALFCLVCKPTVALLCYDCEYPLCSEGKIKDSPDECYHTEEYQLTLCFTFISEVDKKIVYGCGPEDYNTDGKVNCDFDWADELGVLPKHLGQDSKGCMKTCKTDGCNPKVEPDARANVTGPPEKDSTERPAEEQAETNADTDTSEGSSVASKVQANWMVILMVVLAVIVRALF